MVVTNMKYASAFSERSYYPNHLYTYNGDIGDGEVENNKNVTDIYNERVVLGNVCAGYSLYFVSL